MAFARIQFTDNIHTNCFQLGRTTYFEPEIIFGCTDLRSESVFRADCLLLVFIGWTSSDSRWIQIDILSISDIKKWNSSVKFIEHYLFETFSDQSVCLSNLFHSVSTTKFFLHVIMLMSFYWKKVSRLLSEDGRNVRKILFFSFDLKQLRRFVCWIWGLVMQIAKNDAFLCNTWNSIDGIW